MEEMTFRGADGGPGGGGGDESGRKEVGEGHEVRFSGWEDRRRRAGGRRRREERTT